MLTKIRSNHHHAGLNLLSLSLWRTANKTTVKAQFRNESLIKPLVSASEMVL